MQYLSDDRLATVYQAAISAALDRAVLMAALPPTVAAGLPARASTGAQLFSDLHHLNGIELADGSDSPISTWLKAARLLSGLRKEASVFDLALAEISQGPGAGPRAEIPVVREPRSPGPAAAPLVYVIAAEEDGRLLARLRTHLAPLRNDGRIRLFEPTDVLAGSSEDEWRLHMAQARIALVLASADAFASPRTSKEIDEAMVRHSSGDLRLIPVLARHVDLEHSRLAGLVVLPRGGGALSTTSNIDQALVEISAAVRAAADGFRSGSDTVGAPPGVTVKDDGPPAPSPGTALATIFRTSGPPEHTFVEPVEMPSLRAALASMGKGLLVEGPSQIGKSSAVKRALRGQRCIEIRSRSPADVTQLREMVSERHIHGNIVIDDAHMLDDSLLDELCVWVCEIAEAATPRGKVTLLGPPGLSRRVLSDYHIRARFDVVPIGRQPEERVARLIWQGEHAGNVRFTHRAEIARQSGGSFRIAQELCQRLAAAAGLDLGPATTSVIGRHPNEIESGVMASLPFREILHTLIEGTGSAARATLALLWTVGRSERLQTTLLNVERQYPHLEEGLRALGQGLLSRVIHDSTDLGELFEVGRGLLHANDPRLAYFLPRLDWVTFAEQASIDARIDDEERLIVPPPPQQQQRRGASRGEAGANHSIGTVEYGRAETSWMDLPMYPMHLRSGAELHELLLDAFPTIPQTKLLAARVPVRLDAWESDHGIGLAWHSLLKLAAAQGKVRALVHAALADRNIERFHESFQRLLDTTS